MSLKGNVLVSYVSQGYLAIVGIAVVPIYLRYMGTESYALVGLFTMMQGWCQLLDLGITPTMSREIARFRGGATSAVRASRLMRVLERTLATFALVGACAMALASGVIVRRWLVVESLPLVEVREAIALIGVTVAARWVSGLYRGVLSGFEVLTALGFFNIAVATVRFVFVIPILQKVSSAPAVFFAFQLGVAAVELGVLAIWAHHKLAVAGRMAVARATSPDEPLAATLRFSLSVAFTTAMWVAITQTDKLLLSTLLRLTEYAYLSLAVTAAAGITLLGSPIGLALLPRMSRLNAEARPLELVRIYKAASQIACVVGIPASLILALFSSHILLAWTGNQDIARQVAPVLSLYALGNGVLTLNTFPFYLQFAKGNLKLHALGSVLFLAVLLPLLLFATPRYGVIGAGYAWLGANVVYLFVWVPVVHSRLVPGLHWNWLMNDVGFVFACSVGAALLVRTIMNIGSYWPADRFASWGVIFSICLTVMGFGAMGSQFARRSFMAGWARWRNS